MNTSAADYQIDLSPQDYQMAFTEVAFLLDAFSCAIDNIMGGATAPVGRIAGRDTASKLPVSIADPSLEKVVALLAERMGAGYQFRLEAGELGFDRCVIRELCRMRGNEPGGALCRIFHCYLDGVTEGLLSRPVKSEILLTGETCKVKISAL